MARPSKKTEAVIDEICARLSLGEPLAVICRDLHMPDPSTVWDWGKADETVSQRIAHAREIGYDVIADECMAIADDGRRDYSTDDEGREVVDHDHIQRSKLRIDTRLKLLAKWNPKKYGDRQTVEHDVVGNLADDLRERRERAAQEE